MHFLTSTFLLKLIQLRFFSMINIRTHEGHLRNCNNINCDPLYCARVHVQCPLVPRKSSWHEKRHCKTFASSCNSAFSWLVFKLLIIALGGRTRQTYKQKATLLSQKARVRATFQPLSPPCPSLTKHTKKSNNYTILVFSRIARHWCAHKWPCLLSHAAASIRKIRFHPLCAVLINRL